MTKDGVGGRGTRMGRTQGGGNGDNSIDIKKVKVVGKSSKILPFRKKIRELSPHRLSLKKRMKD